MKNNKVLVLEGGFNEEHEVSIATGKEVKKSLFNLGIQFETITVNPQSFRDVINKYDNNYICFNALHGPFGEDGEVQKILDEKCFKYTHSSAESSYIGFNKYLTKKQIEKKSIINPKYQFFDYKDLNESNLSQLLIDIGEFIIKPNCSGSSFGIKIFKNQSDISLFLDNLDNNLKIYQNHSKILVEEFLTGKELTVAVIEKNGESIPIEVTEIIDFNNQYFDYNSKYTLGSSKHILPADLNKNIYDECKKIAKIAHDTIKCRGVSRSDFIFVNEKIYFLEINTQPGLTPISLVPEQLKYQNFSFDDLILNLLKCSE